MLITPWLHVSTRLGAKQSPYLASPVDTLTMTYVFSAFRRNYLDVAPVISVLFSVFLTSLFHQTNI